MVVVCLPLAVQSETSRTRRFRPGWIAFRSELLPTPLWPENGRDPVGRAASRSRSMPRPSAAEVTIGLVAELGVEADHPLVEGQVDEVGLVQDDDRPDAADLGRDQVAVDQAAASARARRGPRR